MKTTQRSQGRRGHSRAGWTTLGLTGGLLLAALTLPALEGGADWAERAQWSFQHPVDSLGETCCRIGEVGNQLLYVLTDPSAMMRGLSGSPLQTIGK